MITYPTHIITNNKTNIMWTAADKQYFKSLDDYEYLKPYLNLDDDVTEDIQVKIDQRCWSIYK